MPLLEHLGVTVVDEHPYEIAAPDGAASDLLVRGAWPTPATRSPIPTTQARVAEVFLGVWAGTVENDGLNRLVLHAGLDGARRRDRARACQYLRQAGRALHRRVPRRHAARQRRRGAADRRAVPRPPRPATRRPRRRGRGARSTRSSPAPSTRSSASTPTASCVRSGTSCARRCAPTPTAASRTSRASSTRPRSTSCRKPRPQHEIWVASPSVEGVHLRAGDIARGGIRWSDRREDFRTEVLGLMKAQTVKNAVIVPVGAKGGFVVKRGESKAAYQTFIRGLLELTDNLRRRRGRPADAGRAARRRRPLPRRRGRQGHRRVLRRRQRARRRVRATGSATRSRRAARPGSTTRRWASRRAARGCR